MEVVSRAAAAELSWDTTSFSRNRVGESTSSESSSPSLPLPLAFLVLASDAWRDKSHAPLRVALVRSQLLIINAMANKAGSSGSPDCQTPRRRHGNPRQHQISLAEAGSNAPSAPFQMLFGRSSAAYRPPRRAVDRPPGIRPPQCWDQTTTPSRPAAPNRQR